MITVLQYLKLLDWSIVGDGGSSHLGFESVMIRGNTKGKSNYRHYTDAEVRKHGNRLGLDNPLVHCCK
jgi:hypothetical protein